MATLLTHLHISSRFNMVSECKLEWNSLIYDIVLRGFDYFGKLQLSQRRKILILMIAVT